MISIHPTAHREHLATIGWMVEKHYDRRTIARHIDEIETIFTELEEARDPSEIGKAEAWGIHKDARYCGPTSYGYRVRFLPDYKGRPVVLGVISGRRRPLFGSRRKPI